ncbi:MAG: metal ABC transporter solute-binding protein, Zn/Mn family, partial [Phycisphaerae bacterium]
VAVSNSLLECAVKDLLGDSVTILRLAEPGTCPGHFAVRPSQISQLRDCRLLLRMDFQKSLDAKLSGVSRQGLEIKEVRLGGGLCSPPTYMETCRQTADALVSTGLIGRDHAEAQLRKVSERMDSLSSHVRSATVSLQDTPVLASVHQKAFCEWLGLNVVGTFRGADVEVTRRLQQAYEAARDAEVKVVIANRPEGRKAADFLADRIDGQVVVFDNFPVLDGRHGHFDDLVEDNVARLLEVAGK